MMEIGLLEPMCAEYFAVAPKPNPVETAEHVVVTIEWFHGITTCPPGAAAGCFELRDRGLDLVREVTCWPKRQHYRLTTVANIAG